MNRKQYLEKMISGECLYGVYCGNCLWCSDLDHGDRHILTCRGVDDLKEHWKLELKNLSTPSLKDEIWEITKSVASGQ